MNDEIERLKDNSMIINNDLTPVFQFTRASQLRSGTVKIL